MRFAILLIFSFTLQCAVAEEPRELIYGAQIMSAQERQEYRRGLAAAKSGQERAQLRAQHRERIRERAKAQGTELEEPHGIARKKGKR